MCARRVVCVRKAGSTATETSVGSGIIKCSRTGAGASDGTWNPVAGTVYDAVQECEGGNAGCHLNGDRVVSAWDLTGGLISIYSGNVMPIFVDTRVRVALMLQKNALVTEGQTLFQDGWGFDPCSFQRSSRDSAHPDHFGECHNH